jgi:hypothetical protein
VPCADALNAALAPLPSPVRFVPQCDLPTGMAYESYIFNSNCCPTREGLHDFFNGLAWLLFPQTKRRLNQLHVGQIAQTGIQPVRGPARDALTVFSENAAFLQCPDALWDALAAKDWCRLFGPLRPLGAVQSGAVWSRAAGEAGLPTKTHHRPRIQGASSYTFDSGSRPVDGRRHKRRAFGWQALCALPVLGVPGWWSGNEDPAFYEDASVFRPNRHNLV